VKLTDAGRTVTEESLPRRNLFLSTTMSLPDELLSGLSVALRLVEIRIGDAAAAAASPAVPPDDEV
jgi:hypothetical protein